MTEMPPELAAALSRLTPEQQQAFSDILQSVQDEESFLHELWKYPKLLAALQSSTEHSQSNESFDLKEILQELSQLARSLREIPRRIELCKQALTAVSKEENPELWGLLHHELGSSFGQNPHGSRAENLEQAIAHLEQALEVYNKEAYSQEWALTQNNLANAYGERICGVRADNLEQAISHYKNTLSVYTHEDFPQQWGMTLHNLGSIYAKRIHGERADNLERTIYYLEQALTVRTRETSPELWAMTLHNLAAAYYNRIHGEHADNLDQAIDYYREVLNVYTFNEFPQDWAMTQSSLANAYRERTRGGRADNLDRAIRHYKQALKVRAREAFPQDWAATQNNLGSAYLERIHGEHADNLEQAKSYIEQALAVLTREAFPQQWASTQNNLAYIYRDRVRGVHADNLKQALLRFEQALAIYTREGFPVEHQLIQRNLGDLHFAEHHWEVAHSAYTTAINVGNDLLATAYTEAGRSAEVSKTARLYAAAAYCLLRLERVDKALVTLEQGKTRLLAEALALSEADLASLTEDQRQALQAARQIVRELEAEMRLPTDVPARRSDRELADTLRQARADLQKCIETIRAKQPEFMPTGLDLPDLLRLIPASGVLVAPLITSQGSAVFVLPHGTGRVTASEVILLDDLTDQVLRELLQGPAETPGWGGWFGAYFNQHTDRQHWLATIEVMGQRLWDFLFEPVHERLQALGLREGASMVLMPQGGLGLLPLHAAWRYVDGKKRYLLDDYTLSYAPSGYALKVSQHRSQEPRRQQRSLLAIVNPTGDLAFTPFISEAVAALFDPEVCQVLEGKEASPATVVAQGPGRSYLYFACHGYYDWQNPMHSGLVLADGDLTLSEIIAQLDLNEARLVTLSACETGLTDIRQSPDEYLGLPAGFLHAGAPAVLSTLWMVDEQATMLLMERCYYLHLHEGLAIPEALRQAQTWLRDVTAGELAQYFYEVEEKALQGQTSIPIDMASNSFDYFMSQDPEYRPFAHPYYWAAFTFSGA